MGTTIAIVSVLLALIAAGCIAYIAWELTAEASGPAADEQPEEQD